MNILHSLALLVFLLLCAGRAYGQPIVVNTTDDTDDGVCDAVHCSLREAIRAANQNPGPDTITFAIPGLFPFVISLTSPLPALTDAGIVLDASTQPGGLTIGVVTIDGTNAGAGANGFEIDAPTCVISGFRIRRFVNGIRVSAAGARISPGNVIGWNSNAGILLLPGADNTSIYGNGIGCDLPGTQAEPNGHGIIVEGPLSNITIGGPGQAINVVAGNTGEGIWAQNVSGITIQANWIGYAPFALSSNFVLPNGANGIRVENSVNVQIGDMTNPLAGNEIGGNALHGVYLSSIAAGARADGNRIGTFIVNGQTGQLFPGGNGANGILAINTPGAQFTGNRIYFNGLHGLEIRASEGLFVRNNNIGYSNVSDREAGNAGTGILLANCSNFVVEDNAVSCNGGHGIAVEMSPGIAPADGIIMGNTSGALPTGVNSTGNAGFGIRVANAYNLLIGAPGQGNTVMSNGEGGIRLSNCLDLILQGNAVGTDETGAIVMGNEGPGILIDSLSEGILIGEQNVIAHNAGPGMQVGGEAVSVTITRNSIFCNAAKGIQMDAGANDDVAPPGEICAGPTAVSGLAGPFDIIELFRHSHYDCDAPPCQGRYYVASTLAGADGRWSIAGTFASGDTLTATATNLLGSTSEFSHCVPVVELPVAEATNSGPVCPGKPVQLLGAALPPAPDDVYEWSGPGNFNSNQADTTGVFPAGVYTLTVSRGFCRSAPDTTEVTVLPEAGGFFQTTLCPGASVTINGTVYDAANPIGTETLAGAAANSCDSIVSINLSFFPLAESRVEATFCAGESLTVNGTVYNAANPSGMEVLAGAAANGCDSIVAIDLSFFPPAENRIETSLCAGESLTVNGRVYDAANPSGVEILAGAAANGCDSIVTVALSFFSPALSRIERGLCPDEFVVVNGQVYDRNRLSGTETITGGSANGCDSVITVSLSFLPASESILEQTICPGAIIIVNGTTYGENRLSGTEVLTGAAANGCDSIVQVRLTLDSRLAGLTRDTLLRIIRGQTVELGAGLNFIPDRITWTPATGLSCSDCPNPVAAPAASTTYTALIELGGCVATRVVQVSVDERIPVYAPNAFSPNDDGINDRFTLYADAGLALRIAVLRIFDRWGGMVFEGKDLEPGVEASGWDGKTRGKPCNAGMYFFAAEVVIGEGLPVVLSGEVNLLR